MSHLEIYSIISNLFNIKFKSQINNLELEFVNIFLNKSLIFNYEYYTIIFDDDSTISFDNKSEFIEEFTKYLKNRILIYQKECIELNNYKNQVYKVDENFIFLENERISDNIYKLQKLIDRINSFKN